MKNIIVPVDFSETSHNATLYALELATIFDASLTLLHVFSLPLPAVDVNLPVVPIQELTEAANLKMKKYFNRLQLSWPLVKMDYFVSGGFTVDEITDYCASHSCDLIVMGITGGGKFKERMIGSNALSVVKDSGFDVLIVPTEAKFCRPKRIVLATDYSLRAEEQVALKLKNYLEKFNAKLEILNVITNASQPSLESAISGLRYHHAFDYVDHDLKLADADDTAEGIELYLESHASDWLVTLPQRHTFFNSLFRESITRKLAFHLHIPIFTLNIKT